MKGSRATIHVQKNAGIYVRFQVSTTADPVAGSWLIKSSIFDPEDPVTALAIPTTTIDAAGDVVMSLDPDLIASELVSPDTVRNLEFETLIDPGLGYYLRFFYGDVTLEDGGPA